MLWLVVVVMAVMLLVLVVVVIAVMLLVPVVVVMEVMLSVLVVVESHDDEKLLRRMNPRQSGS